MTDAFFRNMLLNILQSDNTGMSEEEIQNLNREENDDSEAECAVCVSAIDVGEDVVKLRCGHCFHPQCISRWLRRSGTCPNCRSRATDGELATHPLRIRPNNSYAITFTLNDASVRTSWSSQDTMVDVMNFVSRLDGVDKTFELRSEHLSFKNTESYSALKKSLVRCGIQADSSFRVVNHPNIMVFDLM